MFLNHTQNVTQKSPDSVFPVTDQYNDDLAYDKVPKTKLHVFYLPQLIWDLPYS